MLATEITDFLSDIFVLDFLPRVLVAFFIDKKAFLEVL